MSVTQTIFGGSWPLSKPPKRQCKVCEGEFLYGKFASYNICDDCIPDIRNKFPDDGDTCNICGGIIKNVGNVGYEHFFKCSECGSEWWYD